ncbi:MAG: heavy metal translocating P-type ATPase metal-binding domain-containing protein [Saprospiraceae bacterium]|nr:heavy metal translocating P-type ATPase metal-binding domain-containing protein [Candidatus Brachybacter algidus]
MSKSSASLTSVMCAHCGDPCNSQYVDNSLTFCCNGCRTVYNILNENGLCDYYNLNEMPGISMRDEIRLSKYDYLDNEEIANKLISFRNNSITHIQFQLPQIHCSSCLYLLENLHKINDAVYNARVDFSLKEVHIIYDHNLLKLSSLVSDLAHLGYEPFISLSDAGIKKAKTPDRSKIYKNGIAGFCFANIMMMSLPEYLASGSVIDAPIQLFLKYAMISLSLPVIFYSGQEFFTSAWKSLREGFLNIDAPIAFAIAITFIRSIYEMIWGSGSGYLDSMSGIIFFMLVGRLMQDQAYKSMSFDRDYKSFFPLSVKLLNKGKLINTEVEDIKVDDVIRIHNGEIIPVDALLSKGKALIDYSFVTGESNPTNVKIGEIIYAGGKQLDENIELVVIKPIAQSYLTNLWNNSVFSDKKHPKSFIHSVSRYFTVVLLLIGITTAAYWIYRGDTNTMWRALTAVFIVACPCALLLSTTYTYGNLMRIFSQRKFYLRHHDVIEAMTKIDHIVFDKTGTLTDNHINEVQYVGESIDYENLNVVYALLDRSNHSLSKAIKQDIGIYNDISIENFKNIPGKGIEAWYNDRHYKIGSASFINVSPNLYEVKGAQVFISIDGKTLGCYGIKNIYREGVSEMIKAIGKSYKISILSGDNENEKKYLQSIINNEQACFFNQAPQEKLEYIKTLQSEGQNVMMVGDGLNDAGALKQSDVGIAINDSGNNFTPAADGILDGRMLSDLNKFLYTAVLGRKVIFAAFAVSILYNIIGLYYSVQGLLSPMIAAILMPLSSLTILLITYSLSGYLARKMKIKTVR